MKCENNPLCGGTIPLDQGRELKGMYRRLSEAEHAWHYICQQLDTSRELVDEHTHAIIHLEHTNEQQDLELDVIPHVMKILIKLLKMKLSLKAREDQTVKVSNQNLNYQDFKFEVYKCYLVWIYMPS
jgi:ATP adenylyltransferase/5',5'''-P-1,P-4-tetraphosphate phosphorylase II